MASLKGSRTDESPRRAFPDDGCSNRLYLSFELAAEAWGHGGLAVLSRAAAEPGAAHARCHLDFLVAGYDTSGRSAKSVAELTTALTEKTGEHTAVYAGMVRAAYGEGFEETSGRFETLAMAGRPHSGGTRRALENTR